MARELSAYITGQITNKNISKTYKFYINSTDYTSYVLSWDVSYDRSFGSASASFVLNNNNGIFGEGGALKIEVGDIVELVENYGTDTSNWKRFYGKVEQRSIAKDSGDRTITLTCLDYISLLQHLDIDLIVEGTKTEITNETLVPNYLNSPNDMFSQVFDFANNSIADNPKTIITFKDKNHLTEDPQYDGFEVLLDAGQLKLGAPINARDNYDVIAKSYYFYTSGKYIEDILEEILTQVDGYGKYLFNETSAQAVIDNHLTTNLYAETGSNTDTLTPNLTSSTITIKHQLTQAYEPESGLGVLYLDSTEGLPESGQGSVNGDIFTWTSKGSGNTLEGIPTSGSYALKDHIIGSYISYTATYDAGQVWYLTYSNILTNLSSENFIWTASSSDTLVQYLFPSGQFTPTTLDINLTGSSASITNSRSLSIFEIGNQTYNTDPVLRVTCLTSATSLANAISVGSYFEFTITPMVNTRFSLKSITMKAARGGDTIPMGWGISSSLDNYSTIISSGALNTKRPNWTDISITLDSNFNNIIDLINFRIYIYCPSVGASIEFDNITLNGSIENISYFDKRYGRIILDEAISTSSTVTCNTNYSFKTLQASGVELNKISFRSREVENRFEAINKLRNYLAPNYIIRTIGDNKIWSNYLSQKTTEDYTLSLIQRANYLEDSDLYTRILFYGKNKNPTNLMFDHAVDFVTTGESYKAYTNTPVDLTFSETVDGWHIFTSAISNAGKVILDNYPPIVYIDNIPIDNQSHRMIMQPVKTALTSRTETTVETDKWGNTDVSQRTYYYYRIYFGHQNILPSQSILLYNANGTQSFTISPNDGNMDYGRGIYYAPGDQQNSTIESLSTSTYYVLYATRGLEIDYDTVKFKINSSILPNPTEAYVTAQFEYYTVFTPAKGVGAIVDGRWDTQVQTEFFAQPPSGYNYAILDLGAIKNIQAIDLVAGFYRPDEYRKFDIDVRFSMQYSTDGSNYYVISDETTNFQLTGGESKSFEENELGTDFQARYLKVILENVKKVDFGEKGVYVVAITELSIYDDIVLKSEAKLIPSTYLTVDVVESDTTIFVNDTTNFTDPDSGETATAYIGTQPFTYTSKDSLSLLGCTLPSGTTGSINDGVYQTLEGDTTLNDDDDLLSKLGDRVYKDVRVDNEVLYTQTQLDDLSKAYLQEFYKNHSKIEVDVAYAPHLYVGQTVSVTDAYNSLTSVKYFIESVKDSNGYYTLILARYP